MPAAGGVVAGRLPAGIGAHWRAGRGCGLVGLAAGRLTLASGGSGGRAQRRRSIRTMSTMITIRTMVPMLKNMGVPLGYAPASRDGTA
jgi:hypothetical protein